MIVVPAELGGWRADSALSHLLPGVSRRLVRRWIRAGAVRIDGARITTSVRLRPGQQLVFPAPPDTTPWPAPDPSLDLGVLYADEDIIAVDKPAGMPSAARSPYDSQTVANFLLAQAPPLGPPPGPPRDAGLLHRLDNDTSGVLLAARTSLAFDYLRPRFHSRGVRKEYLAVVEGRLATARVITLAVGHDPRDPRRMRVSPRNEPTPPGFRPASTRVQPLCVGSEASLVRVAIHAGVRHQIRVHLAAIGHPIRGDRLYGVSADAPRLLLHAYRVAFPHPRSGRRLLVEAPVPPELQAYDDR